MGSKGAEYKTDESPYVDHQSVQSHSMLKRLIHIKLLFSL